MECESCAFATDAKAQLLHAIFLIKAGIGGIP